MHPAEDVAGHREEDRVITIPTTELIGGINDVLPIITDPKSSLAGIVVEWTGEKLVFTAYDVYSGGSVEWIPGEGAEGEIDLPEGSEQEDIDWGGDDEPWRTWIWLDSAKEILKLFKLPAKLWRFPVRIKCTVAGDLQIERVDSPRGNRDLRVPGDPDKARKEIPGVAAIATAEDRTLTERRGARFNHQRLGAFGTVRPHGLMLMHFGDDNEPVSVLIGSRYRGFIHFADAKNVRPFSLLRDGKGLVASAAEPDLNVW